MRSSNITQVICQVSKDKYDLVVNKAEVSQRKQQNSQVLGLHFQDNPTDLHSYRHVNDVTKRGNPWVKCWDYKVYIWGKKWGILVLKQSLVCAMKIIHTFENSALWRNIMNKGIAQLSNACRISGPSILKMVTSFI